MPGASSQFEAGLPSSAGRYDGRGVDHGSPAELSRATRLSRPARPVSDQRHFVALLYTLSRDTTEQIKELGYPVCDTALYHRITYQEAISQGMSVAEYDPGSKAAQEIRNLCQELQEGSLHS